VKLNPAELGYVRARGLYVTEKCDGCASLLNQTRHYTITGRPQVYCSAFCRDTAFFGDRRKAEKLARPGRCAHCGGSLSRKKRGALYCDDVCRKAFSRKMQTLRDAGARRIADTGPIQSLTCKDENRRLGQSP
jgi:hypothetical protein